MCVEVAGTAPLLKVELVRGDAVVRTYRPKPIRRRYLRLVWTDTYGSRRVDDSLTTGRIVAPGGSLRLVASLNTYTRTDAFVEEAGTVRFRSSGYSGITRGVLLEALDDVGELCFQLHDRHLGATTLEEEVAVSLQDEHVRITRPLRVDPALPRWRLFTPEPHLPEFALEADWVDVEGPRALRLRWDGVVGATGTSTGEGDAGDYFYVRLEQIDGAVAWSSPVWCR